MTEKNGIGESKPEQSRRESAPDVRMLLNR